MPVKRTGRSCLGIDTQGGGFRAGQRRRLADQTFVISPVKTPTTFGDRKEFRRQGDAFPS
jgi:hypothetical protein